MMDPTQTERLECWLVFQNEQLIIINEQDNFHLLYLPSQLISDLPKKYAHKLGIFNEYLCFCAEIEGDYSLPEKAKLYPLRKAFELLGQKWFQVTAKAYSIIHWDKTHAFCGRCGNTTYFPHPDLFEKMCRQCAMSFYPRISPSIIVLIKKNDQLLMARSPHFAPGVYGLIAGFVETGESVEEAVHREVKEEVNIQIKNLNYYGSQAWPFPDSLMIGFTADYASGELLIDHHEIEAADWYSIDNMPGGPSHSLSIGRKLIDHFISEQQQKE